MKKIKSPVHSSQSANKNAIRSDPMAFIKKILTIRMLFSSPLLSASG
jgi:hypothetical protein